MGKIPEPLRAGSESPEPKARRSLATTEGRPGKTIDHSASSPARDRRADQVQPMTLRWTGQVNTSSPSPRSQPRPSVSAARVSQVLEECAHALGEAVALAHGMAGRARAWSVAEAIREDAEALSLHQRTVRALLDDLRAQTELEVRRERLRMQLDRPGPDELAARARGESDSP